MRPILAVTMVVLGLSGAAPDPDIQDANKQPNAANYVQLADAGSFSGNVQILEPAIKSDREFVLSVPDALWSEQGHNQDEAVEPPPTLDPASADRTADEAPLESINDLCGALFASAQDNDLPVPFFANLIWQESKLQHDAVSPVGALGIAQFMPQVAVERGLDNPLDPRQAIPASARLLRDLRLEFGNLGFVAAAYNAGPHRVSDWLTNRRTLPLETRIYVVRVTGRSVEQWRKAPPGNSALTLARPMPCRNLPAYAELEHELKVQHAQQSEEARQLQIAQVQEAHEIQSAMPHRQAARRFLGARRLLPLQARGRRLARIQAAPKAAGNAMARNFRGRRFMHAQHAAHERRRLTKAESFRTAALASLRH